MVLSLIIGAEVSKKSWKNLLLIMRRAKHPIYYLLLAFLTFVLSGVLFVFLRSGAPDREAYATYCRSDGVATKRCAWTKARLVRGVSWLTTIDAVVGKRSLPFEIGEMIDVDTANREGPEVRLFRKSDGTLVVTDFSLYRRSKILPSDANPNHNVFELECAGIFGIFAGIFEIYVFLDGIFSWSSATGPWHRRMDALHRFVLGVGFLAFSVFTIGVGMKGLSANAVYRNAYADASCSNRYLLDGETHVSRPCEVLLGRLVDFRHYYGRGYDYYRSLVAVFKPGTKTTMIDVVSLTTFRIPARIGSEIRIQMLVVPGEKAIATKFVSGKVVVSTEEGPEARDEMSKWELGFGTFFLVMFLWMLGDMVVERWKSRNA